MLCYQQGFRTAPRSYRWSLFGLRQSLRTILFIAHLLWGQSAGQWNKRYGNRSNSSHSPYVLPGFFGMGTESGIAWIAGGMRPMSRWYLGFAGTAVPFVGWGSPFQISRALMTGWIPPRYVWIVYRSGFPGKCGTFLIMIKHLIQIARIVWHKIKESWFIRVTGFL